MSLSDVSLGFLAADIIVGAGIIFIDREYFPDWDGSAPPFNTGFELLTAFGGASLMNYAFMNASRNIGLAHAAAGALLGWYFWPQLLKLVIDIILWFELGGK